MELEYRSDNIIVQPINDMGDARLSCKYVKQVTDELGFSSVEQEQIQIAAREITSNLVMHKAVNPFLAIYKQDYNGQRGISMVSSDHGPGIPSITNALADCMTSRGGMGCGLGAIRRMMDEFSINSLIPDNNSPRYTTYQSGGTTILASKWCKAENKNRSPFQWGGISRPREGDHYNGDSYYLFENDSSIRLFVIDGLGHGLGAEKASKLAISVIKEHCTLPFSQLFPRLHAALNTSRGVAMMAIQLDKNERQLTYCGIGNVEASISPHKNNNPVSRPGVLGRGKLPSLLIRTIDWPDNGMLIVHTDGVSRRWDNDPSLDSANRNPLLLSHLLLRDYGRYTDDATVLIIQEQPVND